jgi:hypothetical protein
MSRRKLRMLYFYIIALVLFFLTSLLQLHRGPAFICDHLDGKGSHTEYRLEYGLPYPYVKRSVSDFDCKVKGFNYSENFLPSYNTHEVNYFNLSLDLYVWITITYFITQSMQRNKKR